jgi:hypothetical protein
MTPCGASPAPCQRFRERLAHERRRIVEQHDHCRFGRKPVLDR